MKSTLIRQKFLKFFESRGHAIVPSSSLIPDDQTTLFTSAGMQPMVPYLLGEPHPKGKRIANSQRCFRAQDIEEVGDNRHTTFFEMLGNWSFGDYFKKEQLEWIFTFLTDKKEGVGLDPKKLYVTVFAGNDQIPRDNESAQIWKKLFASAGIEAKDVEDAETKGMRDGRIFYYGEEKNWWSLAGVPSVMPAGQPGGPDSEMFYEFSDVVHDQKFGTVCHPNCDCGRYLEIGNNVFMEYIKNEHGSFDPLPSKNVDFGGGLERITMASQDKSNIFETDVMNPLALIILSENIKAKRIIADHIRASVHLIADGVEPSNKGKGYILRRLLRRAALHAIDIASLWAATPLGSSVQRSWNERSSLREIAAVAIDSSYFKLTEKKDSILAAIDKETGGFFELLKSRKELKDLIQKYSLSNIRVITGEDAFRLSSTFGIPIDYIKDQASQAVMEVDMVGFEEAFKKHQEVSRAGREKKFGGHGLLLDTGELKAATEEEVKIVTRLHTATHLLQQALRDVLGPEVKQNGSDITAERTRFDFTFGRKLTDEELKQVEARVQSKIQEDLPVAYVELPRAEAEKTGALFFFKAKYGDVVKVYYMGKDLDSAWSKEFCGGPHVSHTSEIGKFKIVKEEAVAAGVRRIRGTVD